MFSTLKLFQVPCPDARTCIRPNCLFSHNSSIPTPPGLSIPIEQPTTTQPPPPRPSTSSTIPAKRPLSTPSSPNEPPRKNLKVAPNRAVPTPQQPTSGPPVLRINAAASFVPLPVRQALLKTLYDHFVVLYDDIPGISTSLASEHALRQEQEIYDKSNKQSYRVAIIQCCAAIKRRPTPDSTSHSSVGTEAEVLARAEAQKTRKSLRLTRNHLEHLILSRAELETWGFIVEIPFGIGGDKPSIENELSTCDRCRKAVLVKRREEAEECIYHWGKPISRVVSGQRVRVHRCCGKQAPDDEGCASGPHVFYENKPEDLHARHAFSYLKSPPSASTVLDVASVDCEMVYTTGGMRVARVSVVDGNGDPVFDELVTMDEGVHIIDFNTRFSGITEEEYGKAVLSLSAIREALDRLIDRDTILIGHGLDNDLNTLRIIHHNNVDTSIIFKHSAGPPYRKALRDLAREHLGISIQNGGGSVGHSSLEDCIATLDLVKWYITSPNSHKT
ncbi:Exonuclease domain-containing protein [Mycena indigotica]|uniref:Exonuclease domain-containing protein n=1 Tax=Mycena indigotica TaxID=2126181 RepID=A0A8H6SMH7_9AGAR|nr:Exonuclease domain-containing protein [Mycena indigotica]KAF7301748.1 Exonuclease domain-containing protein [Mycena indigotica]